MDPLIVGVEPGADNPWFRRTRPRRTRIVPAGLSISAGSGCRRRSGEVGDVAGTPVPLESSVLSSGTRGCRGSEDGLADLRVALEHRLKESDRLGEESPARRRGDPERSLALQFNRFRNPYGGERTGRKRTLIQSVVKTRNLCVEQQHVILLPSPGRGRPGRRGRPVPRRRSRRAAAAAWPAAHRTARARQADAGGQPPPERTSWCRAAPPLPAVAASPNRRC